MEHKTDFERELDREIEHDKSDHPARHKKRKSGGKAEGHTAAKRLDRHSRRQAGGLPGIPVRPGMGGVAPGAVGRVMPTRVMPRPMGAAAPAMMNAGTRPAGFRRGGSAGGQKWIPGQGVEEHAPVDSKSRGRPVLESDIEGMKDGGKWIQDTGVDKPGHKGRLHRALHVPEGEKIPEKKLQTALHSDSPHMRHMAQFAKNVK